MTLLIVLAVVAAILALGFFGMPAWGWALVAGAVLGLLWPWLALPFGALALLLAVPRWREKLLSRPIAAWLKSAGLLPVISETERTALDAGTVWVDGELFSGAPDWRRILDERYADLSPEEQAFLEGPAEEVCAMTDDWDVTRRQDLPPEVWDYLKAKGFFGMIIPKAHGGLGFSALGHGAVVSKLASRSLPLAVTVMVPNSLGPAELLVHYGTREQKEKYLPRLASGAEMPCFALTEPEAGSDAGSMHATGILFRGEGGELMLRLNWSKRYITLGSVATLVGLAFKLKDPENLLGKGEEVGITCALIPATAKGVALGMRHDPLGVPFINSPVEGRDVVVPASSIIGGTANAGQGWRMLMETLAAGRGISLPSMSVGGVKLVARTVGAYSTVRRQFGLSIGKFEGIEESLARIGGLTYLMEAAQVFTCGAIDTGSKPSVISAIAKHSQTELSRQAVRDGMDVLGGAGISRGPRNLLGNLHVAQPIGITVEGANILTRTMIIFGQGAIRCHPCALKEMDALAKGDMPAFDVALWEHVRLLKRNFVRAFVLSISRGRLAPSPVDGPAAKYVRKLSWASATFAVLADLAMGTLGGALKRREKLTGRFADALTWMYLGTAVLRRYEAEGRRPEDRAHLDWCMALALSRIQEAFDGIFAGMPVPVLGPILRGPLAAWSRLNRLSAPPSDELGAEIAQKLRMPSAQRDRLTRGIFVPRDPASALGRLERAFDLVVRADAALERVREAVRVKRLPRQEPETLVDKALELGLLTREEAELVREAAEARRDLVLVDAFPAKDFARHVPPVPAAATGGRP